MTVYRELIEIALKKNRDLINRVEKNKELLYEAENARKMWLGEKKEGRKFTVKFNILQNINIDIYMSKTDQLKDVYIMLDETLWKINREYTENLDSSHLQYWGGVIDITVYMAEGGNCRVEKRIKKITREFVPGTMKEDIEYEYAIKCD